MRCRCLNTYWKLPQKLVRQGNVTSSARSPAGLPPSVWLSVWPMKGETHLLALQVSNDLYCWPQLLVCLLLCSVLHCIALMRTECAQQNGYFSRLVLCLQPMVRLLLLSMSSPTSNHSSRSPLCSTISQGLAALAAACLEKGAYCSAPFVHQTQIGTSMRLLAVAFSRYLCVKQLVK